MAENQAKATPARVLMLFTFLFAGVAATLWRHDSQRDQLQTIDFPTALADQDFCPVALLQPGVSFQAALDQAPTKAEYTVADTSGKPKREDRMWKVGMETQGQFFLYQSDQEGESATLWVKSAPGIFYRVSPKS